MAPTSGGRIDPESTAIYLTDRGRLGRAPEAIIDSLLRYARTGEVEFVSVRAMTDIIVQQRIDIAPGVYLAPPGALPPGSTRDMAFVTGIPIDLIAETKVGTAALVVERRLQTLRDPPPPLKAGESPRPMAMSHPAAEEIEDAFARARMAIIAAGGASPTFAASYTFIRDAGWPYMDETGPGFATRVAPVRTVSPDTSPGMSSIFRRAGAENAVLLLAVNRLHASRGRDSEEERAIDLGSCLEILLMRGAKRDNTEITNKIAHRGAWLLGATGAERRDIARMIRQIYSLRSKAVHHGRLPTFKSGDEFETRHRLFRDCDALIGRLVDRLLDGWPDWDDLTLGVGA